ncbi:MAG: hypothetical protein DRI71_02210 [Bacteroidetes bacterium]|nr:MAG: hypothetical protein DRI71_02210 [Bacteroidota bacterium]
MKWSFKLRQLPKELKLLVFFFLFSLLFGYGASFMILIDQTSLSPAGIEENYNGNEENEAAETIKFKKSKFQMLTSIHSHVFTLGVIFLLTGFLACFTGLPSKIKLFLMVEPLVSLIVTFTSLILMWKDLPLFSYLAYLSGGLMHGSFVITILLLIRELYFTRVETSSNSS